MMPLRGEINAIHNELDKRTDIVQRAASLEAWLGSYVRDDSLTLSG